MPLADEIVKHRDLILTDLNAAHDYYANTKAAWRIVQRLGKTRIEKSELALA